MQSSNLLEFAEGSFKEEGKQTKTIYCSLCDFMNHNVGGMKRHILGSHKPKGGIRKHDLDESGDGQQDEKKAKVDTFEPPLASTQRASKPNILDVTVSGMSNDALANLFEDNSILNNDNNVEHETDQGDYLDENLIDLDDPANDDEMESATNNADMALMNIKLRKFEEDSKVKGLKLAEKESQINLLKVDAGIMSEEISKLKNEAKKNKEALEDSLANANKLEEEMKVKTRRIEILQPVVNKKLSDLRLRGMSTGNDANGASEKAIKYKKEIKAKDAIISQLKKDKSELANELRDLQERLKEKISKTWLKNASN